MRATKDSWSWFISYVVLSPQCAALLTLSVFRGISLTTATEQCLIQGLSRLEFSNRRDWFGDSGTTLFWTGVWVFGWNYAKYLARQ